MIKRYSTYFDLNKKLVELFEVEPSQKEVSDNIIIWPDNALYARGNKLIKYQTYIEGEDKKAAKENAIKKIARVLK